MQRSKENSRPRTILLHPELLNPGPGMRRRTSDAKLLHLCYKNAIGLLQPFC